MNKIKGPLYLVLSGVDGVGKTTQARLLKQLFEKHYIEVIIKHYELPRFLVEIIIRINRKRIQKFYKDSETKKRIDKRYRSYKLIWFFVSFVVGAYWLARETFLKKYTVIIYDRYPFLDGAAMLYEKNINPLTLIKSLTPLKRPTTTIAIIIDVPEHIAWMRRKEYSLERQNRQRIMHKYLAKILNKTGIIEKTYIVNGKNTPIKVTHTILNIIYKEVKAIKRGDGN